MSTMEEVIAQPLAKPWGCTGAVGLETDPLSPTPMGEGILDLRHEAVFSDLIPYSPVVLPRGGGVHGGKLGSLGLRHLERCPGPR